MRRHCLHHRNYKLRLIKSEKLNTVYGRLPERDRPAAVPDYYIMMVKLPHNRFAHG